MDTLQRPPDDSLAPRREAEASTLGLVILWSREEPERVGEIALIGDHPVVLGRAAMQSRDRAVFVRQRPGRNLPRGQLTSGWISRRQLVITPGGAGLHVENQGRIPMIVEGRTATEATLHEGAVLELERELLLLCVVRPATLPGPAPAWDTPFGMPDAHGIVGESVAAWRLRRALAFAAVREGHALITGESGTGKELAARCLHACSARRRRSLISRSAATLPAGLVDAELFGNIRDYPNPGMPDRPGLIGTADQTTLFLDEIGELPHASQAHLLRVLDGGEYQRLGERRSRTSDLRLVAATNRAADALKGDFAARMPHRIALPGLDARREDIPLLASHLLRQMAAGDPDLRQRFFRGAHPRMSPELVRQLVTHDWSTHVRELQAMLWRAVAGSTGRYLTPAAAAEAPQRQVDPAELTAAEIQAALDRFDGVQAKAWKALGLSSRHQLARLMKKHGLR